MSRKKIMVQTMNGHTWTIDNVKEIDIMIGKLKFKIDTKPIKVRRVG